MNKSFDDFLGYLGNNKEKWMEYFNTNRQQYNFKFSFSDAKSQENCIIEIAKMNRDITINLLKLYHEWIQENQKED